ncbi:helix-turn-helix domain-containing protein [Bradyrhizobium daqingense]|uniref:Transcriptional regulator GlxA family with amidase domain n=1 Tax=Bradyrhizobium daqingense TaxID=993502 RepID=A0A562LTC7_9BRAD|nr:helix-turn-helix domain-containing protein [Bradyrhizobium daqingense]TWI10856.1 transcriptional regulator GlxA family with amidase domain [Bradyrhizobium daqingense]UFS85894.1 helix-turn-helix domain-containing protein [Bradyrhizobium daqingense]
MPLIDVLVLEGASAASVAITFELIDVANRIRARAGRPPCFDVRVSGSGARWATQLARLPSKGSANRPADVVIVPGLAWMDEHLVRDGLQRRDADTARKALRAAFQSGAEIASSCSAVFLVASAGLLDGRRATTTWWLGPLFRQLFPRVTLDTDAMVLTDRRMATAGAAMAQLDLMLSIIARHAGPDLADSCARFLLLERRQSQSRYMALSFLTAADDRVSRAERWARARLHRAFTISELAKAAGLGVRTFARRCERATGLSPVRFLQKLRVDKAMELLETTRLGLDDIAEKVGYADPSTLRRLLNREKSPGARAVRKRDHGATLSRMHGARQPARRRRLPVSPGGTGSGSV